ncbi:sensor histidine kinase [Geosporobacter ferrireducens]|uniref:sensor histidine kinase n=1 Tax=Geosporobacter ferrireducens TaxID=1424294 RepID=UPI00235340D7|nr:PAS domain S-box protein [Geosporobacter ferrireducens]
MDDLKIIHSAVIALLFVFVFLTYRYRSLTKILKSRDLENLQLIHTLSETKQKYRVLLESIPDAVIVINYDWKVLLANDMAHQLFIQESKETLIGVNLLKAFSYFAESSILKTMQHVMENRTPDVMVDSFSFDNDHTRWFEIHIYPVSEGIMLINIDITERILAEAALSESEQRYRSLIDLSPDMITIEQDHKIVFANPAAASMLGIHSVEELLGKPPETLLSIIDGHRDRLIQQFEKIYTRNVSPSFEEFRFVRHDQEILDIEMASIPFIFGEKPAVQHICRDISVRKKAEEERKEAAVNLKLLQEAREYDRLKTEFFSNISHEFKTPLNVILGTLQLYDLHLQGTTLPAELYPIIRYKKILKQNCYRLLRLINNLLDITKIDSGYFQIQHRNCDMVSLVKEITLSVADYVHNKALSITFNSNTDQKHMACDPDKFERILLNLLSNAIKFTNMEGSISVNFIDYGKRVEIVVKDTGIGIPIDKQEVIFERFRQVDPLLTRNHEGSGIGLALVKSLVEMHLGTIRLQSEVEKGSTFIIDLPVIHLEECQPNNDPIEPPCNVEKIHIEFSDIYHM